MTEQKAKVTQEQAERVLAIYAEVIGEKFGETIPTGQQAAYTGTGPELMMEWDWPTSGPTPTILLEGGISDQLEHVFGDYGIGSLALVEIIQQRADAEKLGVWLEPYASYAVCIYGREATCRCGNRVDKHGETCWSCAETDARRSGLIL